MDEVIRLQCDDVRVIFQSVEGHPFLYTPPAPGAALVNGDVMLACPDHPADKITWQNWGEEWGFSSPTGYRVSNARPD